MPKRRLIDGTNVIRSNPTLDDLERRLGSSVSRERLIELVKDLAERENETLWIIIFDGPGDVDAERRDHVEIRYSGARTADALILEAADDALAVGDQLSIVSSDNELSVRGAQVVKSQDFYDELIAPAPTKPKEDDSRQRALVVIEYLIEKGHLSRSAEKNADLLDDLAQHLDYYSQGGISPQKLAKKVESILLDALRLNPTPDPQKEIYRNLKKFFEEPRY